MIAGVILSGGANSRFGGVTKANIIVEGSSIISRIISTIGNIFDEIIIVTNKPEEFQGFTEYKIVSDLYLNAGPLAGIHSALKSTSASTIFVFAGDMPFLDKKLIEDQIIEFNRFNFDILIPRIGNMIEPLHAIYSKRVLKKLECFLSEGKSRAVRDFITGLNVGYFQIPETKKNRTAFTNINSLLDFTRLGK